MKNVGMPVSEVENASGSGGVSAEGASARGPLRGSPAPAPAVSPARAPPDFAGARARRVLACACSLLTRGSAVGCAPLGRDGVAGGGGGGGSTVIVGSLGAGVVVLEEPGSAGWLEGTVEEPAPTGASAAALDVSANSASAPTPTSSRPANRALGVIDTLSCRAGS
jgi:hypothetical protein